jgi:hypothetical protein
VHYSLPANALQARHRGAYEITAQPKRNMHWNKKPSPRWNKKKARRAVIEPAGLSADGKQSSDFNLGRHVAPHP